MVDDPVPDTERLSAFFGLCYTDDMIANITHRNAERFYRFAERLAAPSQV